MYKMSYYRFGDLRVGYNQPGTNIFLNSLIGQNSLGGFDRTRGYVIGRKDVTLEYLEGYFDSNILEIVNLEAYTTENWLVRIYKVKHDFNRPTVKYQARQIKSKKSPNLSKKVFECLFCIKNST